MSRRELAIPAPTKAADSIEMARLWIDPKEGRSHIALNFGLFGDNELRLWGSLAADLIAHAVKASLLEGSGHTQDELFEMVEAGLRARLADNPTMTGAFPGQSLQ